MQSSANPGPHAPALPPLRLRYENASASELLAAPDVLAVIGFGIGAVPASDPRQLAVHLEPLGKAAFEVWRGRAPVERGFDGDLRWSSDGDYLFFAIEVDEQAAGGIDAAAERAYHDISDVLDRRRAGDGQALQVLRLWNYLDAINDGDGDDERYRLFCSGRARGLGERARNGFSAATAIGRRDGHRVLQVYGLAARVGGTAVENPRQISAWRYPREYGPTSPTFARATRTGADQLLVSGTAAVVGHVSRHAGDTLAQLDETLLNLDHLYLAAGHAPIRQGASTSVLKVYLRDPADAEAVERRIRECHPRLGGLLMLAGDICRRELRVEIDGIDG